MKEFKVDRMSSWLMYNFKVDIVKLMTEFEVDGMSLELLYEFDVDVMRLME